MSEILEQPETQEDINKTQEKELIEKAFSKKPATSKKKKDNISESVSSEPDVSETLAKEKEDGQESTSSENAGTKETAQVTTEKKPEGDTGKKEALVPNWLLTEEKEKRRALEARLAEIEAREKQAQQQAQQPQAPDKEVAYDEWLEHEISQTKKTLNEIREQQAMQELGGAFTNSMTRYKEQNPDFDNCFANMAEMTANQMIASGETNPQKIQAAISLAVMNLTNKALSLGRDPAEYIYELGKHYPRYEKYNPAKQQQPEPQKKKEPDLAKLAMAKKLNAGITGDSSSAVDEMPKIFNDDPVSIAFSKEKRKEFEKARDKVLKHL